MASITCGHCKSTHSSVDEVRQCASVSVRIDCSCGGSGKFYLGGHFENGEYTGTIGTCFRCGGKGYQTPADEKRNAYYDNYVRRVWQ